jgi:hypothetical protein
MRFQTSTLLCVSVLVTAGLANAQEEGAAGSFNFVGIAECARCHDRILFDAPDFVELDEFTKWFSDDKHSRAYLRILPNEGDYESIAKQFADLHERVNRVKPAEHRQSLEEQWGASNQLSAAICDKMNIKYEDFLKPTSENNTAKQCMSCHANWRTQDESPDPEVFKYGVGVGCESCHGPASAWRDPHDQKAWRLRSPQEKQAKFGMVDVRDPIQRSRQCFSCHIGSVEEGKVVTHKMYAAGHPPLPSIEVESFAQQMPSHWRSLDQKADFENRDGFEAFYRFDPTTKEYFKWQPDELSHSRAVVLGGVMALRESIALLAAQAVDETQPWPPLEAFDCASCHHDLRIDQPRTQLGFASKPGRPPLNHWSPVLVKLGFASLLQGGDELMLRLDSWHTDRRSLRSVLDRTPFGDRAELANPAKDGAADRIVKTLDGLLAKIQSAPYDKRAAHRSLEMLLGRWPQFFEPKKEIVDFHGARQAGWAIRVFYADLQRVSQAGVADDLDPSRFEKSLEGLSKFLQLDLPAGASGNLTSQLPQALDTMNAFDLSVFFEQLNVLREAWPSEQKRLESPGG